MTTKKKAQKRPYQQRIITKAIDSLNEGISTLVESPTGSGKTYMGMSIIKVLHEKHGYSIGWCAMRRNLLTQAEKENKAFGYNLPIHYISMFDKNPPEVDILVVDEAQHDAAATMNTLHAKCKPKIVLGLSATPFRSDKVNLCFKRTIRDIGINQLIKEGFLSPYKHYTMDDWTPESVAKTYLMSPEKWGKSLVFFHTEVQCNKFKKLLAKAGVRCEVVTAKTDKEAQIEMFDKGEVDVLVNMLILTEGFDCPELKTVFCRPSNKGTTIQMGGRAFRLHKDAPLKQIVQCKKTPHPFIKTATAQEQYVLKHEKWSSLTINPEIDSIIKKTTQAMVAHYQSKVENLRIEEAKAQEAKKKRIEERLTG